MAETVARGKRGMKPVENGFAEFVRTQRRSKGWSQVYCAKRARIHPQRWNHLERSTSRPHKETVEIIAAALDVPQSDALRAAGYDVSEHGGGSDVIRSIVYDLSNCSDQVLPEIQDFIRFKLMRSVNNNDPDLNSKAEKLNL